MIPLVTIQIMASQDHTHNDVKTQAKAAHAPRDGTDDAPVSDKEDSWYESEM